MYSLFVKKIHVPKRCLVISNRMFIPGLVQWNKSRMVLSHPPFTPEKQDHHKRNDNHTPPYGEIAPPPFEFGHEIEVHTVDADDEGQRNEDRGNDRQNFHNLVGPVGQTR